MKTTLTTAQKANKFHRMFNIALYRLNRKIAAACYDASRAAYVSSARRMVMPDYLEANVTENFGNSSRDVFVNKYVLINGTYFDEFYQSVCGDKPVALLTPCHPFMCVNSLYYVGSLTYEYKGRLYSAIEYDRKFISKGDLSTVAYIGVARYCDCDFVSFKHTSKRGFSADDILATIYNLGFDTVEKIEYLIFYGGPHFLWTKICAHLFLTYVHSRAEAVGWDQVIREFNEPLDFYDNDVFADMSKEELETWYLSSLHKDYMDALDRLKVEPIFKDYYKDTVFTRVEIPAFNKPIPECLNW